MDDDITIENVVQREGDGNEMLPEFHFEVPLERESFERAAPSAVGERGFLDNSVIYHYIKQIFYNTNPMTNQKVTIVDPSFWTYFKTHVERNADPPNVKNHLYYNRFDYTRLITFIHVELSEDLAHWVLAAWDFQSKNFTIFDPLGKTTVDNHVRNGLSMICTQLNIPLHNIIAANEITFTLQNDGFNCGVMCLLTFEQIYTTGRTFKHPGTIALEFRAKIQDTLRPLMAAIQPNQLPITPSQSGKKRKLSDEEKRERDRLRKQANRSQENVEKREKRLEQARLYKLSQNLSQMEIEKSNVKARVRMAAKRKMETKEESDLRKEKIRQFNNISRLNENEKERFVRVTRNSAKTAELRAKETEEQANARKLKDAMFKSDARANQTTEEKFVRNETEKIRLQRKRKTCSENLINRAKSTQLTEDECIKLQESCNLGPMDIICPRCGAKYFKGEKKSTNRWICCENELEKIPNQFSEYPESLQILFQKDPSKIDEMLETDFGHLQNLFPILNETFDDSVKFKKGLLNLCNEYYDHVRNYNSAHSFASMKCNTVDFTNRGAYCFKAHGQIYHNIPDAANPATQQDPIQGQLFFLDTNEATDVRMRHKANQKCNPKLMELITNEIVNRNVFAESCKMMKDVIEEQKELLKNNGESTTFPKISMIFDINQDNDKRRYNPAQSNEIAAVFVSPDGQIPLQSDMIIHDKKSGLYKNIKFTNKFRKSMTYPLFFPKGSPGWHPGLHQEYELNGRKVTQAQYIRHIIAIRETFNPILHGGKLFHQFLVDSYVSIEQERLLFIRLNQKKLNSEKYDVVKNKLDNDQEGRIGKKFILPSSYTGSPRYMREHCQDALAFAREFGKPDLFVTFTCNSQWKEIKDNLLPNQKPEDRPDLVARVFKCKLNMLMKDLTENAVLGKTVAHLNVVEYQKRGLPHAHILLFLDEKHKIKTPEDIDKIVSAEIPSKELKTLRQIVTNKMMHCCGEKNPDAACMTNGVCDKNFPKEFSEKSQVTTGTFAKPKRPNNGEVTGKTYNKKTVFLDNRWVVPYNPYLSVKYDAHINVEICASIKAIKYLFKYVYKGHDRARLKLSTEENDDYDEIKEFVDARYVSAPEAVWRILEYSITDRSHGVQKLHVHLPDEHKVYFKDENDMDELENKADNASSTLLAFFKLNQENPEARQYYYQEIPKFFTYHSDKKEFTPRKRGKTIGRIYYVPYSNQELFFLRMLLLHVKGPTSFDDIKTVDGKICATFREAAKERGLLKDDQEWFYCLSEASTFQSAIQLRYLFITILLQCQPSNPQRLYEDFAYELSDDWINKMKDEDRGMEVAYAHLEKILNESNSTLAKVGLIPTKFDFESINDPVVLDRETARIEGESMYATLNPKQKEIVDKVIQALKDKKRIQPLLLYIGGPGGSGKSYTYQTLCKLITSKSSTYLTTAFTGIAAQLLPEGRTLHNAFGLPLEIDEESTSTLSRSDTKAKILSKTDVFIVDEVSMVQHHILRIIDELLRDLMNTNVPFGGKIILLGGDFRQVLPVKKKATKSELIGLSLTRSHLWPLFTKIKLSENMRVNKDEVEFTQWLLELGDGSLPTTGDNQIDIPTNCSLTKNICQDVFGDLINSNDSERLAKAAIIAPTNEKTAQLNSQILKMVPGVSKTYVSRDEAVDSNNEGMVYPPELLNSIDTGLPPHRLEFKKGCIVMLIRTLNMQQSLCNGTRLQVLEMEKNVLICKILTGNQKGTEVAIPRIPVLSKDTDHPIQIVRVQFPVKLAYAMTINKSQGQTFDQIGIYLETEVFTHGLLYVAFSRVTSIKGISLYVPENKSFLKNVVFKEVLQ